MTSPQITAIISLVPSLETHEIDLFIDWLTNEEEMQFPENTSHIFDAVVSLTHSINWDQLVNNILPICNDQKKLKNIHKLG